MPVTKFFQVAVEGDTSDGREITRQDIQDAGDTYNPKVYGSRLSLEHIRGFSPNSDFKAYGDILATKSEEVDFDGEKKLALFAKLDVTDEMVEINKARQKIYTSMELTPNFAKKGHTYLTGLAFTDSPASLGTEAVKLFSSRKLNENNLFTVAKEVTIEFEESETPNIGAQLFAKVKGILGKKDKTDQEQFSGLNDSILAIAESQKETLEKFASIEALPAKITQLEEKLQTGQEEFQAFKTQMDETPNGDAPRPDASGGDGQILADY